MHFILLAVVALHASSQIDADGSFFRQKAAVTGHQFKSALARPAYVSGGFRLQGDAAESRLRDDSVQSAALGRPMKYRVLVPHGYAASERRYPVLYLLHGLDGDHTDWTTRTNLAEYSRTLPLIIVMPDGGNSWYTNADGFAADRFEDYILTDLQADVARKYRTVNSRHGRAIAGLSMGGYGALKMGLKQPAAFAVAGSFSGAFSITQPEGIESRLNATERARIGRIFGAANSRARRENDVYTLAAAAKPAGAPYLYVDCGTTDFLLEDSRRAVAAISQSGLAYEYHEVAGAHAWDYWDRRIREFLPVLMTRLAN